MKYDGLKDIPQDLFKPGVSPDLRHLQGQHDNQPDQVEQDVKHHILVVDVIKIFEAVDEDVSENKRAIENGNIPNQVNQYKKSAVSFSRHFLISFSDTECACSYALPV